VLGVNGGVLEWVNGVHGTHEVAIHIDRELTGLTHAATVAQWSKLLHAMYSKGGMFTAGKTYHDFLCDMLDHNLWDVDSQEFVSAKTVVPNLYQTIAVELAGVDWSKHTHIQPVATIQPEPETFTLEQIALSFE